MENITPFRLIITIIFSTFIVIGIAFFAGYRSSSDPSQEIGSFTIWGTYDARIFNEFLGEARGVYDQLKDVRYVQINVDEFNQEVLESLAENSAPDLLFIDDTQLYTNLNRITAIPGDNYSVRDYKRNFAEIAELFVVNNQVVGVPIAIDPLVMYYNRDLYSSAGYAFPPEKWQEFYELTDKLTKKDDRLNISRSAIAFGETVNVSHFESVLATLLLQTGNPIAQINSKGEYESYLSGKTGIPSAQAALSFYTSFSDATKSSYSWNRALPTSEQAFLGSTLATYFAPASSIKNIQLKNPNLNFAVEEVPRVEQDVNPRLTVHGRLYGMVIPSRAPRALTSLLVMQMLSSQELGAAFSSLTTMAPARRDLLAQGSDVDFREVIYTEALYAKTFMAPDEEETSKVLKNMVEYITSGRRGINDSIYVSNADLTRLFED